jgi:hypothetical protein
MKTLERSKHITYRWWRSGDKPINPHHIEELDDRAMERIQRMTRDGYLSGELHDEFDDVEYSGYWEISNSL